jgi:5S rRNA maturation endonuclease (ribonuclease M5)
MEITQQEITELKEFIFQLNSINQTVVVEGKRDSLALRKIGYIGQILEFHRFGGIVNFADAVAEYDNIILLFDRDRHGQKLTEKTIQLLQRRTRIDTAFKKKLRKITRGKIMFIEQLVCYESYFE